MRYRRAFTVLRGAAKIDSSKKATVERRDAAETRQYVGSIDFSNNFMGLTSEK
jgi:hypothetical protein